MQLVKRLTVNEKGRDFIVGDLHGCFEDLQLIMGHINFDPAQDRLISTGDLIDRGPDSAKCLGLLQEEWFHAVMGNHELMFADFLMSIGSSTECMAEEAIELFLYNGGEWALESKDTERDPFFKLEETLRSMPVILSVETPEGSLFHVAHGDLMIDKETILTDRDILKLETEVNPDDRVIGTMTAELLTQHVVWSRRLISHPASHCGIREFEGLSRVYVGHTICEVLNTSLHMYSLMAGPTYNV